MAQCPECSTYDWTGEDMTALHHPKCKAEEARLIKEFFATLTSFIGEFNKLAHTVWFPQREEVDL